MGRRQKLINGRYRMGSRLGAGGMAVVYLGHDLFLGRDVAIKRLRSQYAADPTFRARFEREARAAASLSHPNIIDIYDVGEEDGLPYIVMELVRGQSLRDIIAAEAPFHPDDVAQLLLQVGTALDFAHAKGYVHRDIKPGNILIDEHGRARVADFGIAKSLADADLTDDGTGFGTAGYLAPEQAEGLMATPASDVYALGVVAFEMLTGEPPFTAETPVGVAMRHIKERPPAPSKQQPEVPRSVDSIVLRALEKDPTRRWPSAGAFAQALSKWRAAADAPVAGPRRVVAAPARTSLVPTAIVALLVVAALAVLLWNGLSGSPNPLQPQPGTDAPVLTPIFTPVITGEVEVTPTPEIALAPTFPIATEVATNAPAIDVAPTIAPAAVPGVVVPNLYGQTIGGAMSALLPLGLRMTQDQPRCSSSIPMNAIAAQDPPAGTSVPAGTAIRVSLSRGTLGCPETSQP
jgi:serine/threonine-protein kinase